LLVIKYKVDKVAYTVKILGKWKCMNKARIYYYHWGQFCGYFNWRWRWNCMKCT